MVIPLGPVRIDIDPWGRFIDRSMRVIKDLTLPIILIWLGSWLSSAASKRDKLNAAVAEAEDRKRKALEREQEEEKQIARILLPKVMDLSGRYYLPMSWSAEKFVTVSADGTEGSEALVFQNLALEAQDSFGSILDARDPFLSRYSNG